MKADDLRRVAIGALRDAIRLQKAAVASTLLSEGKRSRKTQKAVERLDELREAYETFIVDQSSERLCRSLLHSLVLEAKADDRRAWESTLSLAASYLEGSL